MSVGGGTPRAEALLEERRRVLRNALKGEFLRKKYNPANYSSDGGTLIFLGVLFVKLNYNLLGMVFDAAVQRWHAMQFCYNDHSKLTFGNFMKFNLCLTFPLISFGILIWGPSHTAWLK